MCVCGYAEGANECKKIDDFNLLQVLLSSDRESRVRMGEPAGQPPSGEAEPSCGQGVSACASVCLVAVSLLI